MAHMYPLPPIPRIHLQPPSVDFIDNHLPNYHDAFIHPGLEWNTTLQEYAPIATTGNNTALHNNNRPATTPPPGSSESSHSDEFGKFWGLIFSDAMESFKTIRPNEPRGRAASGYSIRNQSSWDGINAQLQRAREAYDGSKQGFRGRAKRAFRKVGDNSVDSLQQVIKLVPDIEYVSPVLSAVRVLLDAFQASSDVRNKAASSFDESALEERFDDIEVFLAVFPDRKKIRDASIELVVSVMKAVEDAIDFFLSSQAFRAISAVSCGKVGYQKQLLQSINDIQTSSDKLLHQAQNLHIAETKGGVGLIWNQAGRLILHLQQADSKIAYLVEKVESLEPVNPRQLLNEFNTLLNKRDERLDHRFTRLAEKLHSLIKDVSRPPTPVPQELPQRFIWAPIVPLVIWPHPQQQQQQQSPSWLPPPSLPPWQAFCPTTNPPRPPHSNPFTLQSLLSISPTLDEDDLRVVGQVTHRIPLRDRDKVGQVSLAPQFRNWIVSPGSRSLLIHGLFQQPGGTTAPGVSALSLFCAMLVHAIRARDKYVALAFFCGLHIEDEDGPVGGTAMARSLVSQLLRNSEGLISPQVAVWDSLGGPSGVRLDGVARGDVAQLCRLLVWLVRHQLSADQTLVCIVDGLGHYETDELEADMLMVLRTLLWLAQETKDGCPGGDHAVVKVLVTSPMATDAVQDLFGGDDEDWFLSITEHPQGNQGASPLSLKSSLNRSISSDGYSDEDDSESIGLDS